MEDPNADLYSFEGRATVNGKLFPLTLNEVVYRGSILRNTGSVVGMVLNTGEECKSLGSDSVSSSSTQNEWLGEQTSTEPGTFRLESALPA